MYPGLSDNGRDGTLFGQRVSAEFVMVLIAKLGGRAEVNMWQEINALHENGVQIFARPKSSIAASDVYELRDRDGRPWPPAPDESVTVTVVQEPRKMLGAPMRATSGRDDTVELRPDLEAEGVIEGEIVENAPQHDERAEAMQWRDTDTLDALDQEGNQQDPQEQEEAP
jgi:hypothetical protein